jgi:hypothetical protein
MDTAIKIVEAFNLATPGIAQLILMIKNKNGTVSVVAMLDEADEKFQETIERGKAWLASH